MREKLDCVMGEERRKGLKTRDYNGQQNDRKQMDQKESARHRKERGVPEDAPFEGSRMNKKI